MEKEFLVIIPAYNEQNNILNVLNNLSLHASFVDIIVINDCSKDQTEKVILDNNYKVITLSSNLGYSGAILTGFKYALSKNYKYVIQFDGNGQHDPREIDKLIQKMKNENCDIVIGSRFKEKTLYNHGLLRSFGTNLFRYLIKMFTGKEITDPTSGLQILNKRAYLYYLTSGNFPEYPNANILVLMLRLGYKIEEVSVLMHDRLSGVGMHSSPIKNIKYMISMFYSIFVSLLKKDKKLSEGV